jgi:hypothetical protein
MYFPRNWKFGSALSKLRNFWGGGGLTPQTPPSVRHFPTQPTISILLAALKPSRYPRPTKLNHPSKCPHNTTAAFHILSNSLFTDHPTATCHIIRAAHSGVYLSGQSRCDAAPSACCGVELPEQPTACLTGDVRDCTQLLPFLAQKSVCA